MFLFGKKKRGNSGIGDMTKAVYDTDNDGRVDNAENVNDGTNSTTASQVKDTYNKRHTQGTDQYLDQGGVNQVSAIGAADAVSKKHTQNSDTKLNEGGANEVSASQIKTAISTTIPAKADKVSSPTSGNFAGLDVSGNLTDSGHKDADYATSGHNHDSSYLNKANTTAFTPDADYEPATKKYVDDSVSGAGGDMSKATYDSDNDGIVDSAEALNDGVTSLTATQILSGINNQIYNGMLSVFRTIKTATLTLSGMVGGFVDAYIDETGVDTGSNVNVTYDTNKYRPTIIGGLDAYVKLLLHMDGTDNGTNFTDSSLSSHSFTVVGNAHTETDNYVFGTASYRGDGTDDAIYSATSDDWTLTSSESWTVDFWVYFDGTPTTWDTIAHRGVAGAPYTGWAIHINPSGYLTMQSSDGSGGVATTYALTPGQWYHIEFSHDNDADLFRVFINGSLDNSAVGSSAIAWANDAYPLYIGSRAGLADRSLVGYLDEFRISKGIARHTSNFSIPTMPYQVDEFLNITMYSEAQSALAVPTKAWFWTVIEEIDSLTINTDVKAYVSRDGGTTYTEGTLEYLGSYVADKDMYGFVEDISSQPSGSDMVYKVVSDNNKGFYLHGTGMNWA